MPRTLPLQTLSYKVSTARQEKDFRTAKKLCKQLIKYYPDWHGSYVHMGIICQSTGQPDHAINHFLKAIQLKPDAPEPYNNLGSIYHARQQWDLAISYYKKAVEMNPSQCSSLHNLGVAYKSTFKLYEAEQCFKKILAITPNDTRTIFHYANLLDMMKRFDDATVYFNLFIELIPKSVFAQTLVFLRQLQECNWSNYEQGIKLIEDTVMSEDTESAHRFNNLAITSLNLSLPCFKRIAEIQGKLISNVKPFSKAPFITKERIHIGYISSDLRSHPVGKLLADFFQYHDRDKFEVSAFSSHPHSKNDEITEKIKRGLDNYYDVHFLSDKCCASLIRQNKVDILIDLNGYTFGNRVRVLAYRPAPIQCSWLGYPSTLHCPGVDYYIGDKTLIPPENAQDYYEQILYLPHCFVGSSLDGFGSRETSRSQFNLPEDKFIFACLNSHYKITPTVFQAWATILKQCPNAVLALGKGRGEANLLAFAKKYSINDRILFVDRIDNDVDYVARYNQFDVYLDTFFYTAGSTAVSVIRGGLPMLSVLGYTNAGRMGCSILQAANFKDGICHSSHEYVEKAVHWYYDDLTLAKMQVKLCGNNPLFNMKKFVSSFDSLLYKTYSKIKEKV